MRLISTSCQLQDVYINAMRGLVFRANGVTRRVRGARPPPAVGRYRVRRTGRLDTSRVLGEKSLLRAGLINTCRRPRAQHIQPSRLVFPSRNFPSPPTCRPQLLPHDPLKTRIPSGVRTGAIPPERLHLLPARRRSAATNQIRQHGRQRSGPPSCVYTSHSNTYACAYTYTHTSLCL